ncbi:SDR family oxidoreductase [uncultured Shewanella sp.]|uniref:SDR family NAD(P)-dependent oxidoreductase n=1 Tax=uncultured Shewanella sp. TaxID=173975 RepID=UPI002633E453|nr:SDR family oxidoreductase [uncultured Shewanella sp.]
MRNILISGAASGIGRSTYNAINHDIYSNIILVDKMNIDLNDRSVICYQCDISNENDVIAIFEDLKSRRIAISHAVNAAGVPGPNKPFSATKIADFDKVIGTNLRGTALMMMHEIAMMDRLGGGRIVNIASVLARCGLAGSSAYAASKAAVVALSKSLAIEYAQKNIQINTLSPGAVDTNFLTLLKQRVGKDYIENMQPVKRMSTPDEIAQYITFIIESDTSFLTGVDIPIDGGYSAQ